MIRIILISLIAPSCQFVGNVILKVKHNYWRYAAIFFIVFAFMLFNSSKAEASTLSIKYAHHEFLSEQAYYFEIKHRAIKLNDLEKRKYQALVDDHLKKAYENYSQAQERCMWIPRIEDKIKAEYCFATALNLLSSANPMSKVVGTTLQLATTYGIHVMQEWREINTLLNYAKYHYEQQEFYSDVLRQYS